MDERRIIRYTTVDEQIELLKQKGLIFENEGFAKSCLATNGYYNIINSYKAQYIQVVDGEKRYIPGTTFEQIYSMFILDHNLRNAIMSAMLDLEEHLRSITAEVLSWSFGTDHNEYLKWENYRDRHVTIERFSLRGILGTLRQNLSSGKDPIKYYRENYESVPPWILLKGTYFSTLINFIRLFKDKQKQELIRLLFYFDEEQSSLSCVKTFLSDVLFICLDYRNRAAHGGRIFNFTPSHAKNLVENVELFDKFPTFNVMIECEGISRLVCLLAVFRYENPAIILNNEITKEINRHLSKYPRDLEYFEKFFGLEIVEEKSVWITERSKKFHINPNCSGIKNAQRINIEELDLEKYVPCKRCIK